MSDIRMYADTPKETVEIADGIESAIRHLLSKVEGVDSGSLDITVEDNGDGELLAQTDAVLMYYGINTIRIHCGISYYPTASTYVGSTRGTRKYGVTVWLTGYRKGADGFWDYDEVGTPVDDWLHHIDDRVLDIEYKDLNDRVVKLVEEADFDER